jgi:phospholipid/cholesterol/gamma-HCH transport system substrate-binding protein
MIVARRLLEFVVGLFVIAGIVAVMVLAFKVSSFSKYSEHNAYYISALFDHIGDLKARAPVTVSGVRVGEVKNIAIEPATFKAKVTMLIDKKRHDLPVDSTANILTAGLIGANYIEIVPGYSADLLKDGGQISETHSAVILEKLIGQVMYQIKGDKGDKKDDPENKSIKDEGHKKR